MSLAMCYLIKTLFFKSNVISRGLFKKCVLNISKGKTVRKEKHLYISTSAQFEGDNSALIHYKIKVHSE